MRPRHKQARGEATRQRVLDAAIEAFATLGFDGASTRDLVARAGTNLTAIRYHFGGKAGVYRAAAEHIAAGMRSKLAPSFDRARATAADRRIPRGELIDSIRGCGTVVCPGANAL